MARYELTDEQWELIENLFPKQRRGGRWLDHRVMLNGMLWVLRSGAPWRDLPDRYGKFGSVNARFNRWRREGLFDKVLKALQIRLDKKGKIAWDLWLVDGTGIRASRAAAAGARKKKHRLDRLEPDDHHLGRSRGGWGFKLHLVTDANGLILGATLTAGQSHESTQLHKLMHAVRRPRRIGWPGKLAGDKGYSYDCVRKFLKQCGVEPVIPHKSNQKPGKAERFDKNAYRKRSGIERRRRAQRVPKAGDTIRKTRS